MSQSQPGVAAIGAEVRVAGFALAGVAVRPAEDDATVRAAWAALPEDVVAVILTPAAAAALADTLVGRPGPPFPVVLPP